jgi:ribosomal protein S18 acetylase RimI-like enzyme
LVELVTDTLFTVNAAHAGRSRYAQWETSAQWTEIERARLTWGLPGCVIADAIGHIQGWSFHFVDAGLMHVGAIVASTPEAAAALLAALVDGPAAGPPAESMSCFLPDRAPGLAAPLETRGFGVERYLYLVRDRPAARAAATGTGRCLQAWDDADRMSVASLLRASYAHRAGRLFAPHDTLDEWGHYVQSLVEQTGCGEFQPAISRVASAGVETSAGMAAGMAAEMAGAIMMTKIAARTAHVAQLVVHPSARGQGLGGRLLDEGLAGAVAAGLDRVTLLVAESNQSARALYASRGFTPRPTFHGAQKTLGADT